MKKLLPIFLVIVICLFGMAGCNNYVDKQSANCNDYVMALTYDETCHKLSAVQTVKFTNNTDASVDSVKFHIYANAYREDASKPLVPSTSYSDCYYNGESWGDVSFDSVKVDDVAVAFTIEGEDMDILSVPLAQTLFTGQTVTVQMVYEVTLANVAHRLGYGENTINLGNFYPVLCILQKDGFSTTPYYPVGDPFVTEVANYDVTITLPDSYVVASSGNLTSAQNSNGQSTYNYQAKSIRDFAMVFSKSFTHVSGKVDGVTVNYYYFNDANPSNTLATAMGMTEFLSQKVAKYPYQQISVVETDFCFGGMEYGNLAMVASGGSDYLTACAHEVAHQWFYGVVGNNQIEEPWMDEGLSEFVTLLYMDKYQGQSLSTAIKKLYKSYTTYADVLTNYYGVVDLSFRPLYKYKNDTQYVYTNYVRGCLLFYTLYDVTGENAFFSGIAKYFDQCKLQIAVGSQMIDCFVKGCKKDVSGIFNAFIQGEDIITQGNR